MSVSIRLSLHGRRNQPVYRIVVSEKRYKRNGKSLDILGFYNPSCQPPVFSLDRKKMEDWIKRGAKISQGLHRILKTNSDK